MHRTGVVSRPVNAGGVTVHVGDLARLGIASNLGRLVRCCFQGTGQLGARPCVKSGTGVLDLKEPALLIGSDTWPTSHGHAALACVLDGIEYQVLRDASCLY